MSNDEDLLNNNFPIQKYTSGAELKTLMSGMLIGEYIKLTINVRGCSIFIIILSYLYFF